MKPTNRATVTSRVSAVLATRLPDPPAAVRRGPLRAGTRWPGAHDPRTAALLGRALGTTITVCFVTGLLSHVQQHPPSWLDLPSRPVIGYQVTQGVHVIAGIAVLPLVLAKLATVYPRLFDWPPARTIGQALERLLIIPLVAGTLFQVATGLMNVVQWYPWPFFFPRMHWAFAWVVLGSMLIHLAIKAPVIRAAVGRHRDAAPPDDPTTSRRAVLIGTGTAVGVVTLVTAGQTVPGLAALSLLAPRDPRIGPQGLPVNRTARDAAVTPADGGDQWRLTVHRASAGTPGSAGAEGQPLLGLSMADLLAMDQRSARLPIACVEGWSATATWSGVRLRDILDRAGVAASATVRVRSLERGGIYASSLVGPTAAADPLTLVALRVHGEPLALDHGYPARLIGPDRPGVLQTKWLSGIEVEA